MQKLKMALVGAGIIGSVHAQALAESEYIDFVAVVDIQPEAARAMAAQYGVRAYTSLESCLAEEEIDAVDICVNEAYHVAPAVTAARAGKHILMEKPIAQTVKEAEEILTVCRENQVRLMVAHLLHFDPRYAVLLDAVRQGKLGDISSIYVKRCNNLSTPKRIGGKVSFLYYIAVHDIELLCAYAGGRPVKVYAQFPNKVCSPYGDDDGIYAIVNFDNGVVGCIEVEWSYPETTPMPVWSVAKVIGTGGAGIVEAGPSGLTLQVDGAFSYADTLLSPVIGGKLHGDLAAEVNHFAKQVLEVQPFEVDLTTPVDAVRIIEASLASKKTGLPIAIEY